jgi:hypothetical protein
MGKFRSTASFGKRQEFGAIAELLREGFDVYLTLVDDQGIDCIIRGELKGRPHYIDVQIKARSKDASVRNAGIFPSLAVPDPRPNLVFIFYSEHARTYWIMPATEVVKHANRRKSGGSKGRYRLQMTNALRSGIAKPRPKFKTFENNWQQIREVFNSLANGELRK